MQYFKRRGLLIATNAGILVVISALMWIVESVWGISISQSDYTSLLVWAAMFGFGGAIVNLFISKRRAKSAYKITPFKNRPLNTREAKVYDVVQQIADQEGIKMPEVGIYVSNQPNAFATGAHKNASLVAVSTGLMDLMTDDEVAAVVGHEMAHILNGDMVTMTLLQGVLNTFVLVLSRIIAGVIARVSNKESGNGFSGMITFLLDAILGFFSSMILMAYSRQREYAADAGAAKYVGRQHMIDALLALDKNFQRYDYVAKPSMNHLMIFSDIKGLMRSHPTTQQRIDSLNKG